MPKTPPKSDAGRKVRGASVIRLHGSTANALASSKAKLERGELEDKATNRLTGKQEAFAQHVSKGNTLKAAVRHAYDAEGMTDKSCYEMGCRMMRNAKIAARVDGLIEANTRAALHKGGSLKAFVVERLQEEAMNAKQDGARVRALELIGKLTEVGAFAEQRIDITPSRSEAEIEQDIASLLDKLSAQRDGRIG